MQLRNGERLLPAAIIYSVLATVCWGAAFYFFIGNLTSWQVGTASIICGGVGVVLSVYEDVIGLLILASPSPSSLISHSVMLLHLPSGFYEFLSHSIIVLVYVLRVFTIIAVILNIHFEYIH